MLLINCKLLAERTEAEDNPANHYNIIDLTAVVLT